MKRVQPNDTVNMDIKYRDLYLVYALLGYCNNTQFVGGYGTLLWKGIHGMVEGDKEKIHSEFFSREQNILETIKFLNRSSTSTHMRLFDRLFNSDYSEELEGIEEELEELERKVKIAESKKSKLLGNREIILS